jgi:3-dehydroquinate dehydratase / shikimate dehydrogenase
MSTSIQGHRARADHRRAGIGRANEAGICATVTRAPADAELSRLDQHVRYLEVRADLAGDLDPRALRTGFDGDCVYSLRSEGHGGAGDAGPADRRSRLIAAAAEYDLVELEADHDLVPELLGRIPPERRRVSWRGPSGGLETLRERFALISEVPARHYLLSPVAESVEHGLAPLQLLAELCRSDVTAFASGPAGTWSRLLAPRLGARIVHGRLDGGEDPGMPTVRRLREDYGFPAMGELRELFGFVGGSVGRSLAPRIYNRGLRTLGLPGMCLPFRVDDFELFWRELVHRGLPGLGVPFSGLTVVSPNKEDALAVATLATARAHEAGAANSLIRAGDGWQAGSTTRLAASVAKLHPAGRTAAVVGCGGAGRSIAAELHRRGAVVTLVNRSERRGDFAGRLLGLPWIPLAGFSPREYGIVVNATPLAEDSPFDVGELADGAAVVDLAYVPGRDTALAAHARARGNLVVDGRAILAAETAWQFELMTGQPLPGDALSIARGGPD